MLGLDFLLGGGMHTWGATGYLSRSVRLCDGIWVHVIVGRVHESKASPCIGCCQEVGVFL